MSICCRDPRAGRETSRRTFRTDSRVECRPRPGILKLVSTFSLLGFRKPTPRSVLHAARRERSDETWLWLVRSKPGPHLSRVRPCTGRRLLLSRALRGAGLMESSLDEVERRAFYFEPQRATTARAPQLIKTSRTAARHGRQRQSSHRAQSHVTRSHVRVT